MTCDSAFDRVRPTVAILVQGVTSYRGRMGCASVDAVARRRWAKVARLGYAIRQARRDRFPRLPIRLEGQIVSADASDSLQLESKQPADDMGVDVQSDTPPDVLPSQAETAAASERLETLRGGRNFPPSRTKLEEWGRRIAPALFDALTTDGNRSAVSAVRLRDWRLAGRQRQALTMARVLDADPTQRDRCPAAWSISVCALTTYTLADFSPEFDRVLCRARDAGDFDFSAVPINGKWGWRRRARIAGYL